MNYITLYENNAAALEARPKIKKAVLLFNRFAPYLFMAAYPLLFLYGFFLADFQPKTFAKLFFLPALTLLLVSVLRIAIARKRPYEAGIIPLVEKKSRENSFPSRHLACGGVISVCFLPYLPIVGGLLLLLCLGLGYTRFAVGWHYPSDLLTGFSLGVLIGLGVFLL